MPTMSFYDEYTHRFCDIPLVYFIQKPNWIGVQSVRPYLSLIRDVAIKQIVSGNPVRTGISFMFGIIEPLVGMKIWH